MAIPASTAYARRHLAAGLCRECSTPAAPGSTLCEAHREARRARQRVGGPWHPGGRGRPPRERAGQADARWLAVDWRRPVADLAREMKCDRATVHRHKKKAGRVSPTGPGSAAA